jgi:hypothetical protein
LYNIAITTQRFKIPKFQPSRQGSSSIGEGRAPPNPSVAVV